MTTKLCDCLLMWRVGVLHGHRLAVHVLLGQLLALQVVAVELAAQVHNTMCDGTNMTNYCGGQPEDSGYTPCSYQIPLLEFKHGRKDCTTKCEGTNAFYEFCTSASEIHPDPQGNGKSVTSFFKSQFGFTARETIALMGAHAIGHTNEQVSGFRHYPWTPGFRNQLLNNEYYKIIAQPYCTVQGRRSCRG